LICKGFISASKDDIVGMSQKGKQFQAKMNSMYMKHLEEQYKMDQMNYQGASSRTHELYGEPSTVYHACTPLSIFNRFKDNIGPWCMKFLSVKETANVGTGTDLEIIYQRYKAIYSDGYPKASGF
jgi:hypothetical protein